MHTDIRANKNTVVFGRRRARKGHSPRMLPRQKACIRKGIKEEEKKKKRQRKLFPTDHSMRARSSSLGVCVSRTFYTTEKVPRRVHPLSMYAQMREGGAAVSSLYCRGNKRERHCTLMSSNPCLWFLSRARVLGRRSHGWIVCPRVKSGGAIRGGRQLPARVLHETDCAFL